MSLDEVPIGGKGSYSMPEEQAPEEEVKAVSGPLAKRVESKVWKVRAQAYEELTALFTEGTDEECQAFIPQISKFVGDSHPGAQEVAMQAVVQLLADRPQLVQGPIACEAAKALIEKGLTSSKASTKSLSSDLLLTIFESLDSGWEEFGQELTPCLDNKNVKVQIAGLSAFTGLIGCFGPSDLPIKSWLPAAEKLSASANPTVRGEAVRFMKETYRWLKDAIIPIVARIKKEQLEEIRLGQSETPPIASRMTKNRKGRNLRDAFDLADPKDIFTRFNEIWCEHVIAMDKWTDRKEALETLNAEADVPKLSEKSPEALVALAKRLLNDSNVQVVIQTIKLVGLLAKGQRTFFENSGKQFVPLLFAKFRDKKAQIVSETHQALTNLLKSVKLPYFVEKVPKFLDDKTPSMKVNLFIFLENCIGAVPEQIQASVSVIVEMIKKYAADNLVEVRDAALNTLGQFLAKTDRDSVLAVLRDLQPAKLKRVQEVAQELGFTASPLSPKTAKPPTEPVRKSARSTTLPTRKSEKPPLPLKAAANIEEPAVVAEEAKTVLEVSPVRKSARVATQIPRPKSKSDLNASQDSGSGGVSAAVRKSKRLETILKLSVDDLRDDFGDKLKEQCRTALPVDMVANMFHKEFKKALEAATQLQDLLRTEGGVDFSDLVIKWIYMRLFDTNTQVLKATLDVASCLLGVYISAQSQLHDVESGILVPILCERTGHNNSAIKTQAREVLHQCYPALAPGRFVSFLAQAFTSKNTRTRAECLEELTVVIRDCGAPSPSPKDIKVAAKLAVHSDVAVRNAALGLFAEMHAKFAEILMQALADFPDKKTKELIEQRLQVQPGNRPRTSSRPKTHEIARSVSPMKSDSPFKPLPTDRVLEVQRTPEAPTVREEPRIPKIPEPEFHFPSNETLLYEETLRLDFESEQTALDKNIGILRNGDMSSRVDALVAVNYILMNNLEKHKSEVQAKASHLVDAMCVVMTSTFDRPAVDIPLRFAKYYLNVLQKVCSTGAVMREISENTATILVTQILNKLLMDDLGKVGEKSEGEQLLKVLNATMVKVLEHSEPTQIIAVLFRLVAVWKRDTGKTKQSALVLKCLMKLEKVLSVLAKSIDMRTLMLKAHECLLALNDSEETSTVKTIKSIVMGVAKVMGPGVWEAYDAVRRHPQKDTVIERWLKGTQDVAVMETYFPETVRSDPLSEVFAKLRASETYDDGLRELVAYRATHPDADLAQQLKTCPHALFDRITDDLRAVAHHDSDFEPSFKISEFQSRLSNMKKRYGLASSNMSEHLTTTLSDLKSKVNLLLNAARPESTALAADAKARLETLRK